MPEVSQQSNKPQAVFKQGKFNWIKVSTVVAIGAGLLAIIVGVYFYVYEIQPASTSGGSVVIKKATSSAETATSSAQKSETADWKTYENKEYNYSLKFPKSWYASTETKVVSEENNIVYHFYAVSKEENQTGETGDQAMVVRYLEGDPCAILEIKKSDAEVSGYKGQRSDCYEGDQLKTILFSFSDTDREEWFIVAYIDKELDLIEKIISTVRFD